MKSFEIEHIKTATYMMFAQDAFDGLLLVEADIDVLAGYHIDGHINRDFLDENEKNEPNFKNEYVHWADIRKFCYDVIKGRKIPTGLKFIFKLPKEYVSGFLQKNKIHDVNPDDVKGLFMNIKYENNKLTCVTGASLTTFTIGDRRIEEAWDAEIESFMRQIDHE